MNSKKDILKTIFEHKKVKEGFLTPENYFKIVEDDISAKLFEEKLPQTSGYNIPESYLDNLEDSILAKITAKSSKVILLRQKIMHWLPVAAAACILLFLSINYSNEKITKITNDDVVLWFENDLNRISENDIALVLEDSDFDESSYKSIFNEATLESYFENVDITDIVNELAE